MPSSCFCLHILHLVPVISGIVIPTSFNINFNEMFLTLVSLVFHCQIHVFHAREQFYVYVIVAVYFAYFESLSCIETPVGHVMCLKRLITAVFWSCELLHNVRA